MTAVSKKSDLNMDQRKEKEPQTEKETITEAIALLAGQAQRTLGQELKKAQSSPNPPFFLKLRPPEDGKIDEEFEKDRTELQNFAEVLAESMAQLLKQAEQSLLAKLKKTQGTGRKNDKINDPKQREDEVRNFTKIFAETRTKLVEDVKGLVKEIRKDLGDEDTSPNQSESLFSILGVEDVDLSVQPRRGVKRPPPKTSYDPSRDISKKPRISPTKSKQPPSSMRDEICYICNERGHWAFQCKKPDERKCYICNETGHISSKCPKPDNRLCYICNKEGHLKSECKIYKKRFERRSRSRSRERSYSSERSQSSGERSSSYSRSRDGSYSGSRR